ncbi:hypothetical protein ACXR2U_01735 [Jatrophihabitans sp. YIM 134969]
MTATAAGHSTARFDDLSHEHLPTPTPWAPLKVTRAQIDAEIERLAAAPAGVGGRRVSSIVHPEATAPGLGFAPGVRVTLEVLKPGESTVAVRRNSGQVSIGIRGTGTVTTGERRITLGRWDVTNVPSMQPHTSRNTGDDLWVRLTYSNEPLLEKLGAAYSETVTEGGTTRTSLGDPDAAPPGTFNRHTAPDHEVSPFGSRLRGYEFITDIEPVDSNAHHWPWAEVSKHLSHEVGDGKRTIMALVNPATQRRNGATHSFFVTATLMPAGTPPRPADLPGHRHSSMAINYHFLGSGTSVVDGQIIDWEAGDLLLSAPSWREHAHSSGPEGLGAFTVQDHPLHIGMESLIWQEDLSGPILTLGSEQGLTGYVGPREAGR